MDLDELRSVRRTERQKDSLQHLRDSFYEDVAAYIEARKAERRRAAEAADDPFGDPEVGRLTDEISTAEDVVEAIYERRVGKVVKLASFAAADMSADKSGLTAEERALFDDLVDRIKGNRRTVLDTLAGEDGDGSDADVTPPDSAATEPDPATGDPTGVGDDPTASETAAADDPPAPDDVLTAAMGGDDAASASGTESRPDRDPVPPEVIDDSATATDSEPDAPVADGAETDGGDATVTAGGVADPSPATGAPSPRDTGDDVGSPRARDATEDTGETDATPPGDDRVTLRITADVGKIYGVDEREYDLGSEDVVRLPATNAGPLVDRGAAERLE